MEEPTEQSKAEFLRVSKALDELLLKQEIFWAQRSRISWLKYRDKNTKFFHSKATQRRQRNYIQGVKNSDGIWVEETKEIANMEITYFKSLFNASTCDQIDDCLSAIQQKMTYNKYFPVILQLMRLRRRCFRWGQLRLLDLMV